MADTELIIQTMLLDLQNSIANTYEGQNAGHVDTGKMIGSIARDGVDSSGTEVGLGYIVEAPHGWLSILYSKYGTAFQSPFLTPCESLTDEWLEQNLDRYLDMLLDK